MVEPCMQYQGFATSGPLVAWSRITCPVSQWFETRDVMTSSKIELDMKVSLLGCVSIHIRKERSEQREKWNKKITRVK